MHSISPLHQLLAKRAEHSLCEIFVYSFMQIIIYKWKIRMCLKCWFSLAGELSRASHLYRLMDDGQTACHFHQTNSTKQSEINCKCLHDSIFETHYTCKTGKRFDYSQQRVCISVGIYIISIRRIKIKFHVCSMIPRKTSTIKYSINPRNFKGKHRREAQAPNFCPFIIK